jgi:hypothetical protein
MAMEFMSFGVCALIKNLIFIKELFKMDNILDLVNFVKWSINDKQFIAIKEIGKMGKERQKGDKITMLIVPCIIKVIG